MNHHTWDEVRQLSERGHNLLLRLLAYAVDQQFIEVRDLYWAHNNLLALFGENECKVPASIGSLEQARRQYPLKLEEILEGLLQEAEALELIPLGSVTYRDLFDSKIMGVLTPRPSIVQHRFEDNLKLSAEAATDQYYRFSKATNYIRTERIAKDKRWQVESEYGLIDITINLSKPEKDPLAIAAAGKQKKAGYPACLLCAENEGYAGHISHPARQNHRMVELSLQGQRWFMQYSPYVYYNEHCIFLHSDHHPMAIDQTCFANLLTIIEKIPHYFVGSNADLPIVGGSILAHEHYQGGRYEFAMAKASIEKPIVFRNFPQVNAGWVNWPLSVLRLRAKQKSDLQELASKILNFWRQYTDEECGIYHQTDKTPHNTITPIARRRGELFELDLVLRNNRTDQAHPLGIFHPQDAYHHIKKENIGLIEVMGLAVLPGRLDQELKRLAEYLVADFSQAELAETLLADPMTKAHATWALELANNYNIGTDNVEHILRQAVGEVFVKVLEDAGVYKRDAQGTAGKKRLIKQMAEKF